MSEWKEKYLHQLVYIKVSNVDKKIYPDKTKVKMCNYMDVYSYDYINSKISFAIGSADSDEIQKYGLRENDVIITKDSETPDDIAVSAIVNENIKNLTCGYHLAILRPKDDEIDGTFLMFKIKDDEIKSYFSGVAKGSTRYGLTLGDIERARIKYPCSGEQSKIAKILSTVDSVIEKTQAAIAKYKAIKQGMLNDLFTCGIDVTTNKLRPRYEDAPELYKKSKLGWIPKEWKEKKLSSVVDVISGGTPSTSVEEYWNGDIPWLSVEDFNNGDRYANNAKKKITSEGLNHSAASLLLPGMIIISARGSVGVIAQMNITMAFNQSCYGLNSIYDKLQNDFIYYFLIYYKKYFGIISFGSVFSTITRDFFDTLFIPVIIDDQEQNSIIERLSHIDRLIKDEQNYLLKQYLIKQGLMQDLLSGKKEVKVEE